MISWIVKDLNVLKSYGTNFAGNVSDTTKDHFYNPSRFVAGMNKKITIMDDESGYDKLVSIDDISGNNWETIPKGADDGQNLFSFFNFFIRHPIINYQNGHHS